MTDRRPSHAPSLRSQNARAAPPFRIETRESEPWTAAADPVASFEASIHRPIWEWTPEDERAFVRQLGPGDLDHPAALHLAMQHSDSLHEDCVRYWLHTLVELPGTD